MLNKNSKIIEFENELSKQIGYEIYINAAIKQIFRVFENPYAAQQCIYHSSFISWEQLAHRLNKGDFY